MLMLQGKNWICGKCHSESLLFKIHLSSLNSGRRRLIKLKLNGSKKQKRKNGVQNKKHKWSINSKKRLKLKQLKIF